MGSGRLGTIAGGVQSDSAATRGKLGDANVAKGGLTFGKVAHKEPVGKLDADYGVFTCKAGTNE